MKRKVITKIMLVFIISTINLFSQSNREVEYTSVMINGQISDRSDTLYISTKDSITFSYSLHSESEKKDPFLFRALIKIDGDSSVSNTGTTILSYKNLSKGNYFVKISAFDLQGNWEAKAANTYIIVDNKLAKFYREINEKNKIISKKDSLISDLQMHHSTEQTKIIGIFSDALSLSLAIVVVVLVVILIVLIVSLKKRSSNELASVSKVEKNKDKPLKNNALNDIKISKLIEENAILNSELTALRGQLEALQIRGDELKTQNNELKKNIEKINNKRAELEDLQQQKDDLFALIIHDIKNPAALMKSLVELLTSYDLSATEQQEIINDIANTTSKIIQLSQEVSKIIAFESNNLNLNIEKVDYTEVVKDVYARNKIGATKKNIELFTELGDNLPEIEIDAFKIDEVLDNLISNAIKFTETGGTVRIKAYLEDDAVVTEVSDNGLGLSEDDIKMAFKRGKRLSAQPTAGETSTGLGLWIVKKLVEAHRGRVWVQSSIGKGSTFFFKLPVNFISIEEE